MKEMAVDFRHLIVDQHDIEFPIARRGQRIDRIKERCGLKRAVGFNQILEKAERRLAVVNH
jgi:hypothetical protein